MVLNWILGKVYFILSGFCDVICKEEILFMLESILL